jgi:Reverse transcriptase (RNA-dependent DNA polymerase)
MPTFLSSGAVSWALEHCLRHGDTDLFPIPFELELFGSIKNEVVKTICSIDLETHRVTNSVKMMSPKHTGGFRAAVQLSPIDGIILTALIGEESEKIEAARFPVTEKRACAYRIKQQANGDLFDFSHGWKDFQGRAKEEIGTVGTTHVLIADIADFYNQVSHHRIENELSAAGVSREKAMAMEEFLGHINGGQHSRGLPIGPPFSIVLAELCLNDVDKFLMKRGYRATRYVDDFRIFCESEDKANKALFELTDFLHKVHRLTLQWSKTGIREIRAFKGELVEPEEVEKKKLVGIIDDMLKDKFNPYDESSEELDDDEQEQALVKAIDELFTLVSEQKPLNIGLARYVLRRAGAKRIRSIYNGITENLEFFLPVYRDVFGYIKKVHSDKNNETLSVGINKVIESDRFKYDDYCKYWIYETILEFSERFSAESILALIDKEESQFVQTRFRPLFSREYKDHEWVRANREIWQNHPVWAQRAFVYSIGILPKDERERQTTCTSELNSASA